MGSFGYIQKPLNAKTIKAKIKNIIKTKLLKDELLREKEKLDNIFRFSSDEIILTDGNFDIITKNNRFFPSLHISFDLLFLQNQLEFAEFKSERFLIGSSGSDFSDYFKFFRDDD